MIFLLVVVCVVPVATAVGLAGRSRSGLERLASRSSHLPPSRSRPDRAGSGRPGQGGGASLDLEATAGLADRLAALLGAGLPVPECWATLGRGVGGVSVRDGDPAAAVAAVATSVARVVGAGGSVGDGLRLAAGPPRSRFGRRGHDGVVWLAALWDLMDGCGAAPAGVLRAVAEALRAERDLRAAADVAAAGPRATVLILMAMPLAAIGLGCGLGADPASVLLFTPAGRVCLVLGCACWLLGIGWAHRLIRAGGR